MRLYNIFIYRRGYRSDDEISGVYIYKRVGAEAARTLVAAQRPPPFSHTTDVIVEFAIQNGRLRDGPFYSLPRVARRIMKAGT